MCGVMCGLCAGLWCDDGVFSSCCLFVCICFFAFVCLYYLISWIPKIVTDLGLSQELGIYSGTMFNVGAFLGIITQGYLTMDGNNAQKDRKMIEKIGLEA